MLIVAGCPEFWTQPGGNIVEAQPQLHGVNLGSPPLLAKNHEILNGIHAQIVEEIVRDKARALGEASTVGEIQLHEDCRSPRQQHEDHTQSGQHTSPGKPSYQPHNIDTASCFTRLESPDSSLDHGQVQTQLREVQDPDTHQEQVQDEPQMQNRLQYHQQAALQLHSEPDLHQDPDQKC